MNRELLLGTVPTVCFLLLTRPASALDLVKDGKPYASIVIGDDASKYQKWAAQWLQEYVNKASGAQGTIRAVTTFLEDLVGSAAQVIGRWGRIEQRGVIPPRTDSVDIRVEHVAGLTNGKERNNTSVYVDDIRLELSGNPEADRGE